jgi:hypothetical protein
VRLLRQIWRKIFPKREVSPKEIEFWVGWTAEPPVLERIRRQGEGWSELISG